jgi:hypothetical protein
MGRSDIPYAQRLTMKHQNDIVVNRDFAAKIVMYCATVAMHELEGIGYKRIFRFSQEFDKVVNEFYADPEVSMAHAMHRMEQIGLPITDEIYCPVIPGESKKQQEIRAHAMQAIKIALICCHITMNDVFGFGAARQTKISDRITELTDRYKREGEGWLLEEMKKIGFHIEDGNAKIFLDENDKPITEKQWEKLQND